MAPLESFVSRFRVGTWSVSPAVNEISGPEGRVQIEAKSMDVLVYLARYPRKVRSKEQIVAAVWGGAFVSDDVLTHAIWDLRRAFGDDARKPRFIQTVHTRGYRLLAEVEIEREGATEAFPATDRVGHYRLLGRLGAGGMGVVYQAEDTRLQRPVALKFLVPGLTRDPEANARFLREARAAARLDHPNIGVVHEIGESEDGRTYLAMTYYDGGTLKAKVAGGPLPVDEAVGIAMQIAEGLDVAHGAGIVHRDVKPANVVFSGDGVAKILDFGLAKLRGQSRITRTGSSMGTVAYMSPEQARGEEVDPRTDLWSLGVVLYEMLSGRTPFSGDRAQAVIRGILDEEPPPIRRGAVAEASSEVTRTRAGDLPRAVQTVLDGLLAKDPRARYPSAAAVLDDLRAVAEGARPRGHRPDLEARGPYPGLVPFTEGDAPFFFGREQEVECLWSRILRHRLLGLVGPSGSGKSSLVHAGLLPARPDGWRCLVTTPGAEPLIALGQALVPELGGELEGLQQLLHIGKPEVALSMLCRWRRRHPEALLVVDQFEELFTLSPEPVQTSFAALLGRLAAEGDVHVLLSMRDDFLLHCHGHEALAPVFSELTPIGPPRGGDLRLALVEPARACGVEFEDESLVDAMLAAVAGRRGTLPLLAFAAAELWRHRDRERRELTREAYERIGGVGGALARHAEATLERVGAERTPVVRELFRNLVTAEGTRAVREREELLSVFGRDGGSTGRATDGSRPLGPDRLGSGRAVASEVLDTLVDARLLTSWDGPATEGEPRGRRQIEIVHEALLAAWPRLGRWRSQDTEGAQLRDELRQAARTWDQHGRSDDLLWTGTALREYELWRERYPGGLSDTEEAFARAMTAHAAGRTRRRRLAVGGAFAILLAVLAVVGALWRASERSAEQARAELRRGEAARLAALGEVEMERYPTAALAWATASLKLADSAEARRLAVRALQQGPPVSLLPAESESRGMVYDLSFSPSGRWLATGQSPVQLRLEDGSEPIPLEADDGLGTFATDELLITHRVRDEVHRWWRLPDVDRPVRSVERRGWVQRVFGDEYLTVADEGGLCALSWYPVDGGEGRFVGTMEWPDAEDVDGSGSWLAFSRGERLFLRAIDDWSLPAIQIGEHAEAITWVAFAPDGESVVALDGSDAIRVWSTAADRPTPLWSAEVPDVVRVAFDAKGDWLVGFGVGREQRLWDLRAPWGSAPLSLRRTGKCVVNQALFHPEGRWLVVGDACGPAFWPLAHRYPWVLDTESRVREVAFTPDSRWLVAVDDLGPGELSHVRAWPLAGQNDGAPRLLLERPKFTYLTGGLDIDPSGEWVAVGTRRGGIHVIPLAGGPTRELHGDWKGTRLVAFGPDGRLLAAVGEIGPEGAARHLVRVVDLDSGESRDIGEVDAVSMRLEFLDHPRLLWAGTVSHGEKGREKVFDLELGRVEVLAELEPKEVRRVVSPDGSVRITIALEGDDYSADTSLYQHDLPSGERHRIATHGDRPVAVALDPTGRWLVTGDFADSIVRVGPVSGGEPHLLYGHADEINAVAVSPDGRWIASGGMRGLRLWPMPDLGVPPLHTLPHEALVARLESLTNLRVVRDDEDPAGWTVETGPFPGWAEVPRW